MPSYKKRKTDANQRQITRMLEQAGYHVTDLSDCGRGVPDLLLTINGLAYLVEIKNPYGRGSRFTRSQLEYYNQVKCQVYVVRSLDEVELLIKGEIKPINR